MQYLSINRYQNTPFFIRFLLVVSLAMAVVNSAFAKPNGNASSMYEASSVVDATVQNSEVIPSSNRTAKYIVRLKEDSVAHYRGGVAGFTATSKNGKAKLDADSAEVIAYRQYLRNIQQTLLTEMSKQVGRSIEPLDQFQMAMNAIVLELTEKEAALFLQHDNVDSVAKDLPIKLNSTVYRPRQMTPDKANADARGWLSPKMIIACLLCALLVVLGLAFRFGWIGRKVLALGTAVSALGMAGGYFQSQGGYEWIGAPEVWFGLDGQAPSQGEGVVIGIIDTGINPTSPSFAEVTEDGYQHTNPKNKFFGVCDKESANYDADFPCNNKLIGAWANAATNQGNPRDLFGHGSHNASTAAGNLVYDARLKAPNGFQMRQTISGVAPHANIIAYSVCDFEQGCMDSSIIAAINQAIIDGVDVINYSLGRSQFDPWSYDVALSFLAAMDAGIFVATSAGNRGPAPDSLYNPGIAPWMTNTAATSHNVLYQNSLVGLTNDQGTALETLNGVALSPAFGPAKIIDAATVGNPQCLADAFSEKFNGEIVICEEGPTISFGSQGKNVKDNGGGAIITSFTQEKADGSGYLVIDNQDLPAIHLTYTDVTALRQWLSSGTGHQARLTETKPVISDETADVVGAFSSRGMSHYAPSVIKPNIAAPGRAVFGAYSEDYSDLDEDYTLLWGTSMASPHIAGAAAIIKSLNPNLSPMQIQSALMTTAMQTLRKEDDTTPADPADVGSGLVDVVAAARAALVLDETTERFKAADPQQGGDPSTLNLASLGQNVCALTCQWTRTVTNASDKVTAWQADNTDTIWVEPAFFSLAPNEQKTLTFTANVADTKFGDWQFDQIHITSLTPGVPDVHFPVAARSAVSDFPAVVKIEAEQTQGSYLVKDHRTIELTDSSVNVFGLVQSQVYESALISDPTQDEPFDGDFDPSTDGAIRFLLEVPEGTKRLVAEITQAQSSDLDLYVGRGEQPSVDTLLAEGVTMQALENINILSPEAGKVWVVVHNYEQGDSTAKTFTLHIALVTNDTETMTVTIPATQPAGELYDATIEFDLPNSNASDRFYGAFTMGTDKNNRDNLGTVMVDLVRGPLE